MKVVKAFVNKENYTSFACPLCERNHRVHVAEKKGVKHQLKLKCSCGNTFQADLNFRQFYRKTVNLSGEVNNVSRGSKNWYAVTVIDLSMSGLKFKLFGTTEINENDRLNIRFTLDDKQASTIAKEVRVVGVRTNQYGCEFLNLAYEEKDLGYYLFPSR